jgi:hypothetical protein
MENLKISLCITTLNRFDNFLSKSLDNYLEYLNNNLIDEIIISDENGNDYEKIQEKYKEILKITPKFKIYKNEEKLGVFKNKLKVCSYASNEYIALIDSDNFPDEKYFETIKKYIETNHKKFPKNIIMAPSRSINHNDSPYLNYKEFENQIITKSNIKQYLPNIKFQVLLNTGNYIISKNIIENIEYNKYLMDIISGCDVVFFNLLSFMQYPDLELHIIEGLEYLHTEHTESKDGEFYKRDSRCDLFREYVIMPEYYRL